MGDDKGGTFTITGEEDLTDGASLALYQMATEKEKVGTPASDERTRLYGQVANFALGQMVA